MLSPVHRCSPPGGSGADSFGRLPRVEAPGRLARNALCRWEGERTTRSGRRIAMPASDSLYQELFAHLQPRLRPAGLGRPAVRRLALLLTGLIAAKSTVLAQIASELSELGVTRSTEPESLARGLRRTLSDPRLTPQAGYYAELGHALDWATLLQGSRRIVLALDESSHRAVYHLLRISLPYW